MIRATSNDGRPGPMKRWQLAIAAAAVFLGSPVHATDYDESVSGDLSNVPNVTACASTPGCVSAPTDIGALTPGDNHIAGSTIPSGDVIDSTGARAVQDNDYVTFTVPGGYFLTGIESVFTQPDPAIPGSPNVPGDRAFLAIAQGAGVYLTGLNGPATGLLGWTLPSVLDAATTPTPTDVLPDLGSSAPANFPDAMFPGATRFSGPLSAGSYTLWILDGDSPAFYDLDLVVAHVPEPSIWMLMALGAGSMIVLRRARRRPRFDGAAFGRTVPSC